MDSTKTTPNTLRSSGSQRDSSPTEMLYERDDIGKLPLPAAAKAYARRKGLKSMMRQPKDFTHVNAMLLNPGKPNVWKNYDAVGSVKHSMKGTRVSETVQQIISEKRLPSPAELAKKLGDKRGDVQRPFRQGLDGAIVFLDSIKAMSDGMYFHDPKKYYKNIIEFINKIIGTDVQGSIKNFDYMVMKYGMVVVAKDGNVIRVISHDEPRLSTDERRKIIKTFGNRIVTPNEVEVYWSQSFKDKGHKISPRVLGDVDIFHRPTPRSTVSAIAGEDEED